MAEYIEKQAALDIVNGWRNQLIPTYGKNNEYVKCLETVAEHLESLHAADVWPVVRGRWINICGDSESPRQCSECLQDFDYIDGICYLVSGQRLPPYCPNCGADMRGGDAE